MKIITKDAVYVQYCDIFNLMDITRLMKLECPQSVSLKCFRNDVVVNGDNRYAFMEFKEKDAINYFKKIDCIIDYAVMASKTEEEIVEMFNNLAKEAKDIIDKYNKMDRDQQIRNYKKMHGQYHLKSYKAHSISDYLAYRKGELQYNIPENLKLPEPQPEKPNEKNFIKTIIDIF